MFGSCRTEVCVVEIKSFSDEVVFLARAGVLRVREVLVGLFSVPVAVSVFLVLRLVRVDGFDTVSVAEFSTAGFS
ncbi:MAG: hypothetical protein ACD_6C00647G0001 [uncultured bacterium]|nr:MAG: hypothetical protein ACD_6C00647G0001 [uncultured bacterium]